MLGHSGCGAVSAAVDAFLNPEPTSPLAAQHALRGIVDRLLVVVAASAKRMAAVFGPDVVQRPGYRARADRGRRRIQCRAGRVRAAARDRGRAGPAHRLRRLSARRPAGLVAARRKRRMRGPRVSARRPRGLHRVRRQRVAHRADRAAARRGARIGPAGCRRGTSDRDPSASFAPDRGGDAGRGACRARRRLPASAQDIEPRAYSNAPVGVNFLVAGYAYTRGGLSFDTALPITDVEPADEQRGRRLRARARDRGQSGQVRRRSCRTRGCRARRSTRATRSSASSTASSTPRSALSVNLYGAPALSLKDFAGYEQDLIVGASLRVVPPAGPVRRHAHRQHRHEPLVVQARARRLEGDRPWTLEATAAATLFTRQHRLLRRQHARAGPALLDPGPRDLQLSLGHLGVARRHLLHRRADDDRRRARQQPAAELAAGRHAGVSRSTSATRSSSTRAAGCPTAPATAST